MEIKQPKPGKEVIQEIESLLRNPDPSALTKYISEQPGFAFSYVDMVCADIELRLTSIRIIAIQLSKIVSDGIMKDARSPEGGIPIDISKF